MKTECCEILHNFLQAYVQTGHANTRYMDIQGVVSNLDDHLFNLEARIAHSERLLMALNEEQKA